MFIRTTDQCLDSDHLYCEKLWIHIRIARVLRLAGGLTGGWMKSLNQEATHAWFLEVVFVPVCVCLSVCLSAPKAINKSHETHT